MEPVRVGVIGCGVIGQKHMEAACGCDHIDLVAVADLVEAAREKAKADYSPRKVYATGEELLADRDVEAVVLALPTGVRFELALAALAAGKHVLLEKPVAMNVAQLREIMAARGKMTVGCASSRPQFKPHSKVVKEIVASGKLGPIREVHMRAFGQCGRKPDEPRPVWRLRRDLNGGGILVNWGCYDMDYLLGLCGWKLQPRTVLAAAWPTPRRFASHVHPTSDAETHFTAMIRCAGGEVISLERGEYMPTGKENAWQIIGEDGSLSLQMVSNNPTRIVHYNASEADGAVESVVYEGDEGWAVMHQGPVVDFAAAIREGREPMTGLAESLVLQQITDAIYASAETGRAVEIET